MLNVTCTCGRRYIVNIVDVSTIGDVKVGEPEPVKVPCEKTDTCGHRYKVPVMKDERSDEQVWADFEREFGYTMAKFTGVQAGREIFRLRAELAAATREGLLNSAPVNDGSEAAKKDFRTRCAVFDLARLIEDWAMAQENEAIRERASEIQARLTEATANGG